jgi:hypothetical protein
MMIFYTFAILNAVRDKAVSPLHVSPLLSGVGNAMARLDQQ